MKSSSKDAGIERAHEQGGPTSPFACELCNGSGKIITRVFGEMGAQYDCPECDGSGNDAEKLAKWPTLGGKK